MWVAGGGPLPRLLLCLALVAFGRLGASLAKAGAGAQQAGSMIGKQGEKEVPVIDMNVPEWQRLAAGCPDNPDEELRFGGGQLAARRPLGKRDLKKKKLKKKLKKGIKKGVKDVKHAYHSFIHHHG